MIWKRRVACGILCLAASCATLWAQNPERRRRGSTPVVLTLKRSIDLALQNSKDIQLAKIQTRVADNSANLTQRGISAQLVCGFGRGYTYGLPETPGGRPPSIFSLTYTKKYSMGRCGAWQGAAGARAGPAVAAGRYPQRGDGSGGDVLPGTGEGATFAGFVAQGKGKR